jgi:hypothetical protein
MMIIPVTKSQLLTDGQWQLVRQYHITDRSNTHAESLCRRCGTLIGKSEPRAEFYLRDKDLVLIAKGFVHIEHLRGNQ